MKVLDLFSGIGAYALGAERAGARVVGFCENDPYCQRVLARHWPGVPCAPDIETRAHFEGEADAIIAGFPCQDLSDAGDGAGLAGERSGLFWPLMRAVRVVRPLRLVLENVAGLLVRGMGDVLGAVAGVGMDAEWDCVPAGFPFGHERKRVLIVANACSAGLSGRRPSLPLEQNARAIFTRVRFAEFLEAANPEREWSAHRPLLGRGVPRVANRVDRIHAIGNSNPPALIEAIVRGVIEHDLKAVQSSEDV